MLKLLWPQWSNSIVFVSHFLNTIVAMIQVLHDNKIVVDLKNLTCGRDASNQHVFGT